MLGGLLAMQQASCGDCPSFDPFPFDEDGLAASEVDVGGGQVAEALVVSAVIVVGDEGYDEPEILSCWDCRIFCA